MVNYNLSLGKRLLRAEASTGVRDRGLDRLDMWESVEHAKVKDMSRRHGSRLLGAWLTDRLVVAGLADTGVFGGRLSRSPSSLCEAEIERGCEPFARGQVDSDRRLIARLQLRGLVGATRRKGTATYTEARSRDGH